MSRFAAAILFSSLAAAQSAQQSDIAIAAKAPLTLAMYIQTHRAFDWNALWSALGAKDPQVKDPPCGEATDNPCSAQLVSIWNPDQVIVIVEGAQLNVNDIYLRYVHEANGSWRFAGEHRALVNGYPRRHEIVQIGGKPILKISSDYSQPDADFTQEVEDWFDLTEPDLEPIFSFTANRNEHRVKQNVGRTISARTSLTQAAGVETIDLVLDVDFLGPGFDFEAIYVGIYDRSRAAKKFTLRSAYSGLDRRTVIPPKDFEVLAGIGPEDPSNEQLLAYALPGLQKVATGSDAGAKEWLRSVLNNAKDTPEKRSLLALLGTP